MQKYAKSIDELMNAVDENIPTPEREVDKPFLMPIEDVFSISGRGTVATGRVEQGVIKINDKLQMVGLGETRETVATGLEMFNKLSTKRVPVKTSVCCSVELIKKMLSAEWFSALLVLAHPTQSSKDLFTS